MLSSVWRTMIVSTLWFLESPCAMAFAASGFKLLLLQQNDMKRLLSDNCHIPAVIFPFIITFNDHKVNQRVQTMNCCNITNLYFAWLGSPFLHLDIHLWPCDLTTVDCFTRSQLDITMSKLDFTRSQSSITRSQTKFEMNQWILQSSQ